MIQIATLMLIRCIRGTFNILIFCFTFTCIQLSLLRGHFQEDFVISIEHSKWICHQTNPFDLLGKKSIWCSEIHVTKPEKYKWRYLRNTNDIIREILMAISEKCFLQDLIQGVLSDTRYSLSPEITQPLKAKLFSPPMSGQIEGM